MTQHRLLALFLSCFVISGVDGRATAPQSVREADLRRAMLAAEDGRPLTRAQAAPLLAGLRNTDPSIQRTAVRALGRLEDPQFADEVAAVLAASSPEVRSEAANALGQIAGKEATLASERLFARLTLEPDGAVRSALGETLGRLPYATPGDMQRAEQALAGEARAPRSDRSREGAVKGLEALMRRGWPRQFRASPSTIDALETIANPAPGDSRSAGNAAVRRLAMLALAAGRILGDAQAGALSDPDAQVRRLAIVALLPDAAFDRRAAMVERALKDPAAMVRYEAIRVHARHLAKASCAVELAALEDPDPHVRLVAIDQLGLASACPGDERATGALVAEARRIQSVGSEPALTGRRQGEGERRALDVRRVLNGASAAGPWHAPAHAIVSLARRAPDEAKTLLPQFVVHPGWQIRVYAARAADALGDTPTLTKLAGRSNGNVQEAALAALVRTSGRDADAALLASLRSSPLPPDQVVLQAARGLKGTPRREDAVRLLLSTLKFISDERRETSRDPRLALLDRIAELGDVKRAPDLEPYLKDFDPAVADRAAEVLSAWTGKPWKADPKRTAGAPAPTPADIDALPPGIRITLESGRSFEVAFYLDDTPITAWRIMRKVNEGYYNGLTFHRILPGFIVQGGSPGANEFVGDGPFMRDEFSLRTNARGTLGVSTRGRDTGDAQFYINLVDNPRLDHEYTVFGEITAGIGAIDTIVEGDRIVTIEPLAKLSKSGER